MEKITPNEALAIAALWSIAGFAIQVEEAPRVEDYEDAESAYNNGENVALWSCGMEALAALAAMGVPKAAEYLAANRALEEERDTDADDSDEEG